MRHILIRWLILTIAIGITAQFYSGVTVTGGIGSLIIVAAIFGLVNAFVRPIVTLLTCPLVLLTLGLFTLVINTLMFLLTDQISSALSVNGFWSAFWASLIVSIISAILSIFIGDKQDKIVVKKHVSKS